MSRFLPLCVAFLLLLGCEGATDPIDYEDFVKADGEGEIGVWVHSGLYNRLYRVHTPPGMTETGSYPVLIFLHGTGGTGGEFERGLRAHSVTDSAGFITVYPDGMQGMWSIGCEDCTQAEVLKAEDVSFIETLTEQLMANLPVDPERVYLAGYSQGGALAYFYGCTSRRAPAGIAVVAGLIYRRVAEECQPADPFPVVVVHGTEDPIAYYTGYQDVAPYFTVPAAVDLWAAKMGCDPQPTWTEITGAGGGDPWVTSFRFPACGAGGGVIHHRIDGGGHTWPGNTGPWSPALGSHRRSFDTTREILKFFSLVEAGG